uniref:Uncharacterized protein n=1 Tax=Anguilla anguilla TaxID=7936 RepID=A0A0E9QRR9_ANGAN
MSKVSVLPLRQRTEASQSRRPSNAGGFWDPSPREEFRRSPSTLIRRVEKVLLRDQTRPLTSFFYSSLPVWLSFRSLSLVQQQHRHGHVIHCLGPKAQP